MGAAVPLSPGNSRVKHAAELRRRSVRAERGLFLAEGLNALESASRTGRLVETFATADGLDRLTGRLGDELGVTVISDPAMRKLSDAVTPPGVVAVCSTPDPSSVAEVIESRGHSGHVCLVICVEPRDPGNLGTIIRTADAAGAAALVVVGDSVDVYNAKTVRASAGSVFDLPCLCESDAVDLLDRLATHRVTTLAATGDGEVDLFEAEPLLDSDVAWLFGNEAHGLPPELAGRADHRVRIPMSGHAESLNLSVAAGICLYATARVHEVLHP